MPYPWHRPEAKALFDALIWDIRDVQRVDLLVRTAAPTLQPLNLVLAPAELWKDALDRVAVAGALLVLCRALATEQGVPRVSEAAQRMVDARPVSERLRIGASGPPVLDRTPLRRQLTRLADDQQLLKVIVVRGTPKSGKSWGRHLFEELARERGARRYYVFNGSVASARVLVTRLFETLGRPELEPPQDSSDRAWYQTVCNRLAVAAAEAGTPLWIVVDDLGPGPDGVPLQSPDIKEFFDEFGLQLLNPAVSTWFRLMLIHYPGEVPTNWDGETYIEDRPEEADVTADHVRAAIEEWAHDHHRNLLEDDLLKRANDIVAAADADTDAGAPGAVAARPPRLRRIKDALVAVFDELEAQP